MQFGTWDDFVRLTREEHHKADNPSKQSFPSLALWVSNIPKACGVKVLPCLLASVPIVATTNHHKFTVLQLLESEVKGLHGSPWNKITSEQDLGIPGGLDKNLLCFPSSSDCLPSLALALGMAMWTLAPLPLVQLAYTRNILSPFMDSGGKSDTITLISVTTTIICLLL